MMMEDLTAAQARAYDAWFQTCWGAHAWAGELGAVDEALPDIADHIVVEVGCGTGRLVDHLASRGARVLGVDLSAGMLAVAAGRVSGRLVRAEGGTCHCRTVSPTPLLPSRRWSSLTRPPSWANWPALPRWWPCRRGHAQPA